LHANGLHSQYVSLSSDSRKWTFNELFFFIILRHRQVLNFDSPRGGVGLETEKTRTGTVSKLLVTRAAKPDDGNYTCMPSRGKSASAFVHVIDGRNSALSFSLPLINKAY